jgi:carbon-monoxide dehydrogenase iron sulfur subunit
MHPELNDNVCIRCGHCAERCPSGAMMQDILSGNIVINAVECYECELCIQLCDFGAIKFVE